MFKQMDAPVLTLPVSAQRDHILGSSKAGITILEFGDFECPFCREAHFILKDIMGSSSDLVQLAYRHFPLTQVHPHSQRAAEAAEAAGAQGRFWEMHDLLFENQHALDDYDLVNYASALNLDVMRFRLELLQGTHIPRVREDFLAGIRSGVNGTPSFFVDGRRYDGPWDLESLNAMIEARAANR